MAPSITMPTAPRAAAIEDMISPMIACAVAPPASTTITSPGWAISIALCTIRLSPAGTRTVSATPSNWPFLCQGRSAASLPASRDMLSERCAQTTPLNFETSVRGGRGGRGWMQKPIGMA